MTLRWLHRGGYMTNARFSSSFCMQSRLQSISSRRLMASRAAVLLHAIAAAGKETTQNFGCLLQYDSQLQ